MKKYAEQNIQITDIHFTMCTLVSKRENMCKNKERSFLHPFD